MTADPANRGVLSAPAPDSEMTFGSSGYYLQGCQNQRQGQMTETAPVFSDSDRGQGNTRNDISEIVAARVKVVA